MKKLIVTLLIMMLALTVLVACGGEKINGSNSDGSSNDEWGSNSDTSSVASLTSEQENLWWDVSIDVGLGDSSSNESVSSDNSSSSATSSTASTNSSSVSSVTSSDSSAGSSTSTSSSATSSFDKDQGYDDWIPLP